MLIVTDAHVTEQNSDDFFAMLDALEQTSEDVVFLGDIFELWVGHRRYEDAVHLRFIDWCRRNKSQRSIGFIEGNHEFYVVHRHHEIFTWSDGAAHREGTTLFVHGDLMNPADTGYLRLRKLTKNPIARNFFRFVPFGRAIVAKLKKILKSDYSQMYFPEEAVQAHTNTYINKGLRQVFAGHFHRDFQHTVGDVTLAVLPDWLKDGSATQVNSVDGSWVSAPWRQLPLFRGASG